MENLFQVNELLGYFSVLNYKQYIFLKIEPKFSITGRRRKQIPGQDMFKTSKSVLPQTVWKPVYLCQHQHWAKHAKMLNIYPIITLVVIKTLSF